MLLRYIYAQATDFVYKGMVPLLFHIREKATPACSLYCLADTSTTKPVKYTLFRSTMHFKRATIIFFAAILLVLPSAYAALSEDPALASVAANVQGGLVPTPQPTLHETEAPAAQASQGLSPQADAGANPEWDDADEVSKCGHCGHSWGCGWNWPSWCCC